MNLSPDSSRLEPAGRRILIVDDDRLNERILPQPFKGRGALVVQISSANTARNHLLGMVAHDLHGPLASICGLTDFLADLFKRSVHLNSINATKKGLAHRARRGAGRRGAPRRH
jgi:hypothetical protein